MNTRKALVILGFVLATTPMLSVAQADEIRSDQATKLTFNQSVQIPGSVLPAGTYLFMRAGNVSGDGNIIRIFNSDRTKLYATLLTISTLRANRIDKTELIFAERGATQPKAILAWYFPGRDDGHEFVYPRQEEKELARARQENVVAGD
jgi:hypothetical protein